MKHVTVPYGLVFKYYWFRLFAVSLIWFIYDVSEKSGYHIESTNTSLSSQLTPLASTLRKFWLTFTETRHHYPKPSVGTPLLISSISLEPSWVPSFPIWLDLAMLSPLESPYKVLSASSCPDYIQHYLKSRTFQPS